MDGLHSAGAENVAVDIAVSLKRAGNFRPIVCVTRNRGPLERVLQENDVRYIVLDRRHSYEAHKFRRLDQLIHDESVRILHAHKLWSNFWGSIVGALSSVPLISHFHAHHAKGESWRSLMAARLVDRVSRKIISISEYERTRLIEEENISPDKIETIYNGINLDKYRTEPNPELRRELGIDVDAPVVGIVAAFRPQKHHELFLRAARDVLARNPDAVFLLVGDGVKREAMETHASELGIAASCRFAGFRADVPAVISAMDIGVLSSHWEGLPIAMLEYMASARPVVSTNVSGVSEVLDDGDSGYLVPPDDGGALAGRINDLLADRSRAQEMGRRGRQVARDKFSQDTMIRRIEGLYSATLATNGRRR